LQLEGFQDPGGVQGLETLRADSRTGRPTRSDSPATPSAARRAQAPSQTKPSLPQVKAVPLKQAPSTSASSLSIQIPSINLPNTATRSAAEERHPDEYPQSASRPSLDLPSGRSYSPQSKSGSTRAAPRARPVSPTPSNDSRKQSTRDKASAPSTEGPHLRREHNERVSFFDPANQASLDRLISGPQNEGELEEESVQATMADVEEMLDGYEWASDDIVARKASRGAADLIEARLLDELMALDKVVSLAF
jgi:hypothetical protein